MPKPLAAALRAGADSPPGAMPSPKSAKGEAGVRLQRKSSSLRRRGRSGGGSGDPAAWAAAAAEGGPLLVDQVCKGVVQTELDMGA